MQKESYLFQANGQASLSRLLTDLEAYHRHPGPIVPSDGKSALLVLDMQRYFLDESSQAFIPAAQAILPRIKTVLRCFEQMNRPIWFTRHGNDGEDAANMASWWGRLLKRQGPYWPICDELLSRSNKHGLLDKTQYDAFYGTDLLPQLRLEGVDTLHLCGVMTHLCCETTARSAFVQGFAVIMVGDATATYNYDLHLGSLRGLAQGVARISWSKEYR